MIERTEKNVSVTIPGVHVWRHLVQAVVCHFLGQVCIELLFGDVLPLLGGDGLEGVDDLVGGGDVLRLLGDHVGHVVLQRDGLSPVGVNRVKDGFKLRLLLACKEPGYKISSIVFLRMNKYRILTEFGQG